MADATQYIFNHKELTALLVKHQGIHEGLWQLVVSFGFGVSNVGPNNEELNPAAMIAIGGIGIQKATDKNGLTVDAAEVNPAPGPK